jgi:protein-S-isoprenylcysteine O-methyltransferase Ste14
MKSFIPSIVSNSLFLSLLLLCAGRWDYWPAWLYLAVGLTMSLLVRLVLRNNPALLAERLRPQAGAKGWDKRLLAAGFLLTIVMLVIAGLDAGRWHLHPILSWPACFAGLALELLGMGIFLRALKENRFFSSVVRIQSDREHSVCTTGPYRLVRHPGYLGMLVGMAGAPLLLMSAWSAIPASLFVVTLIVRTRLEDAVLQRELVGYRAYCETTRYRLVPALW